jgi:Protein of unknown function (DUF3485)
MGIIRISTAVVMIVGAGLVHGAWTNRWGPSPELKALGERFDTVPMVIGDWKGTPSEVPAGERAMAGATACLSRVYTSPSRGISVSVLLLGGLPGKISTHTPDVCYGGAGFDPESAESFVYPYGSNGHQAEFRTAMVRRGGTSPSALRIFWAWNADRGWKAPQEPRWEFGSESALCKLYVIRETWGAAVAAGSDPCNDFLAVLLPELDRCVFSARK